ncbi:MAG: hypothetical protein ABFS22_07675 [Pseudomonadota bacterium]
MLAFSKHYLSAAGITLGFSLLLAPLAGVLAADDYLSVLEAEAADTGSTHSQTAASTTNNHKSVSGKAVRLQKIITPGLDFDQFEAELHSRYSGTHLLYMKLSAARRKAAWKHYQQDNALSAVRESIVSLMSSS